NATGECTANTLRRVTQPGREIRMKSSTELTANIIAGNIKTMKRKRFREVQNMNTLRQASIGAVNALVQGTLESIVVQLLADGQKVPLPLRNAHHPSLLPHAQLVSSTLWSWAAAN
ncbi:hypothetical protein PRIPAC_88960, partial [Pristionchus pacificus]|uniref:Uncharacterized protein n=1 Tax=Pristionchus pacificus TaxID=54126 RepID=A0A2A6B7J7_PRIPA